MGDVLGGPAFYVHLIINFGLDCFVDFIAQGGPDTKNIAKRFSFSAVHNSQNGLALVIA